MYVRWHCPYIDCVASIRYYILRYIIYFFDPDCFNANSVLETGRHLKLPTCEQLLRRRLVTEANAFVYFRIIITVILVNTLKLST